MSFYVGDRVIVEIADGYTPNNMAWEEGAAQLSEAEVVGVVAKINADPKDDYPIEVDFGNSIKIPKEATTFTLEGNLIRSKPGKIYLRLLIEEFSMEKFVNL